MCNNVMLDFTTIQRSGSTVTSLRKEELSVRKRGRESLKRYRYRESCVPVCFCDFNLHLLGLTKAL